MSPHQEENTLEIELIKLYLIGVDFCNIIPNFKISY